jgi:hypothetical protein
MHYIRLSGRGQTQSVVGWGGMRKKESENDICDKDLIKNARDDDEDEEEDLSLFFLFNN